MSVYSKMKHLLEAARSMDKSWVADVKKGMALLVKIAEENDTVASEADALTRKYVSEIQALLKRAEANEDRVKVVAKLHPAFEQMVFAYNDASDDEIYANFPDEMVGLVSYITNVAESDVFHRSGYLYQHLQKLSGIKPFDQTLRDYPHSIYGKTYKDRVAKWIIGPAKGAAKLKE